MNKKIHEITILHEKKCLSGSMVMRLIRTDSTCLVNLPRLSKYFVEMLLNIYSRCKKQAPFSGQNIEAG